jgi:hypothetical protein
MSSDLRHGHGTDAKSRACDGHKRHETEKTAAAHAVRKLDAGFAEQISSPVLRLQRHRLTRSLERA